MDWSFLTSTQRPRVHVWSGSPSGLVDATPAEPGCLFRWLRGSRMRTREGLMDEWAAAAQFPPHFGGTWDSLRDCLSDLPEGGTFLILEADQLLRDAPPEDGTTLMAVLADAAEDLAPQPFHLVMQVEPTRRADLVEGLRALKVAYGDL
ncbi:barstar family protein [Geothrix oryzisoli]|uniref:barstar family protein n=1 Tax=Geothrix oryzisoli TaxID=2922721 RepID=UPI001FAC2A27|nr:barstar family protein [Geothrix oryzisoli]